MTIRGGYYLGGNANPTADLSAIRGRAVTQYRSLTDGAIFPGWDSAAKGPATWLTELLEQGDTLVNVALELKQFGPPTGGPAPTMRIQRRDGVGVPAYGYDQVLAGELDGRLSVALEQLLALPNLHMVNIQWASEFDTDHEYGITMSSTGSRVIPWQEADWRAVDALHYIMGYWLNQGLPPVAHGGPTFSIGMGGFNRSAFLRMHEASLAPYFSRMQWNAYRRVATQTPADVLTRTRNWATADLPVAWLRMPVIIAEYGTPASLGSQAEWLAGLAEAVEPMHASRTSILPLEAVNYFNSNPGWATLNPKAEGLAALAEQHSRWPFQGPRR